MHKLCTCTVFRMTLWTQSTYFSELIHITRGCGAHEIAERLMAAHCHQLVTMKEKYIAQKLKGKACKKYY